MVKGRRGEERVLRVRKAEMVGYGEVRLGGKIGIVVEVVEV